MTTAFNRSLTSSCRSMNAFTASSADTFLARICSANLVADMKLISVVLSVDAARTTAGTTCDTAALTEARRKKLRRLLSNFSATRFSMASNWLIVFPYKYVRSHSDFSYPSRVTHHATSSDLRHLPAAGLLL